MTVQVTCPQCRVILRAPDHAVGKKIRCPKCSSVVPVIQQSDSSREVGLSETQGRVVTDRPSPETVPVIKQVAASGKKNPATATPSARMPQMRAEKAKQSRRIVIVLLPTVLLIIVAATAYWAGRSAPQAGSSLSGASEAELPAASVSNTSPRSDQAPASSSNASETSTAFREESSAASQVPSAAPPISAPPAAGAAVPTAVGSSVTEAESKTVAPTAPPAGDSADASVVRFERLELDEPVTSLTITEDGHHVIMSHQTADIVSVYDVVHDRVVHVIGTSSPRALMSRGDRLFVGNFGKGTISVFSASKGWSLENELQVTKKEMVHISAPRSRNFAGEILVTCHGPGQTASYEDSQIYLVDVARDRCHLISRDALASSSYDGKTILAQSSFNLSPGGTMSVYPWDAYVKGNAAPMYQGGAVNNPYVYQTYAGSWWIGDNRVFGGAPISLAHDKLGLIIVPDIMQRVIYTLDEDLFAARRMNAGLTEITDKPRRVEFPPEQNRKDSGVFQQQNRYRRYLLDHPAAATHDDVLSIFLLDQQNGAVLRARTSAISIPEPAEASATVTEAASEPSPSPFSSGVKPRVSELRPDVAAQGVTGNVDARVAGFMENWPVLIPAGSEFRHSFPAGRDGVRVELVDGPSGMTMDTGGLLAWTPTSDQVGLHELKIKVENSSGPYFERPQIEVISEELARSVRGDLTKVNQFESFELDTDHYAITSGFDRKSMLLLQGKTLRVLSENGISVQRTVELPERYHDIEERENVYVAVSNQPPALDVIDRKTLKIRRHIELRFAELRVLEVTDLAIHPGRPISFICIKHSIELPRYTVLTVDEQSGQVVDTGIVGTWAEVDSDGQTLFTGYRDIYERGVKFHVNPDWRLIQIPEYGSVDMLMAWRISGSKPELRNVVRQAGGNGKGIRVSGDGRRITYLSFVGTPQHSKNLMGFSTRDFDAPAVEYATKDRASTTEAAFHPFLPWVAMPGDGHISIFHQETGAVIANRLLATLNGIGTDPIERVFFSPDGKSIQLLRGGGETGRYLQSIPLLPEKAELSVASRKPEPKARGAAAAKPEPKAVRMNELTALRSRASSRNQSPQEIGREFMNSVVLVLTPESTGTGFVVGDQGLILTCAHVVETGDGIRVVYNVRDENETRRVESAEILKIDHERDIALLRFRPEQSLKSVRFRGSQSMETGEPITVIGNPGAGEAILSHTMTSGIISNPLRDIEGFPYVQLSAAVNPGNSGGPMFDQHGNVAGLIALKARIEGAAFAVPIDVLREFLKSAAD